MLWLTGICISASIPPAICFIWFDFVFKPEQGSTAKFATGKLFYYNGPVSAIIPADLQASTQADLPVAIDLI